MAGRPKHYQQDSERPVTMSLRIPCDLARRTQAYAREYRLSVTQLLLDGLEWRLTQHSDQSGCPPFDATTKRLGPLCKYGHEWGRTGQSLRYYNPNTPRATYCIECNKVENRRRYGARGLQDS